MYHASDPTSRIEAILRQQKIARFGTFHVDEAGVPFPERWQALKLPYGVVFGIELSRPIIESLVDRPTRTYLYHYRQLNSYLDRVALAIVQEVQAAGGRAFPVPSSQIVDWDRNRGHISHRLCAVLAGLGWIGRNNLLVVPGLGSRLRLATVLTDLELPPGNRQEFGCGDCYACLGACPVEAIHESPRDFDLEVCEDCLRRFRKTENLGSQICGLCVKACGGSGAGGSSAGGS